MKNFFKCFFLFFSTLISAEIKEHQGILATLYVQDSAEYYANSINVYRSAIDKLPSVFQAISQINPFFHIINVFRYGFLGTSDGDLFFGIIFLPILSLFAWFVAFVLYKKGYKIKS